MLAVLMFVSSVGITMNAHYCFSTNTLQKGLFASNLSCAHESGSCKLDNLNFDSTGPDCCKTEVKKVAEKDCCKDFSYYVKLVTDVDLPNIKIVFNQFLQFALQVIDLLLPATAEQKSTVSNEFSDSPPPLSGLALLVSISQLKIDHHTL